MTPDVIQPIRWATRRRFTAEERIRIISEGIRSELPVFQP